MTTPYQNTNVLVIDEGSKYKLSTDQLQLFKPGAVYEFYNPSTTTNQQSSISSTLSKDQSSSSSSSKDQSKEQQRYYLNGPISSIDFHNSGAYCLASTLHNDLLTPQQIQLTLQHYNYTYINPKDFTTKLHLFNAARGTHSRLTILNNSYMDNIKFSHHYSSIIHSGYRYDKTTNKNGITLGYTSLVDGVQLQEFIGHTDKITSISLNPVHDSFLTSSLDNTIRIYDLRSELTQGMIRTANPSLSAIDPQGIVFAIATNNNCIKLYDFRTLENGPFNTIWLSNLPPVYFTSLSFTPDGTSLLLGCTPQQSITNDDNNNNTNKDNTKDNTNQNTASTSTTKITSTDDNIFKDDNDKNNNESTNNTNNTSTTTTTTTTSTTNNESSSLQSELTSANPTFSAFNYILLIDAFNGQLLQRISTPRNTYPLDQTTLQSISVDDEMISYAPIKVDYQTPPIHYGQPIYSIDNNNNTSQQSTMNNNNNNQQQRSILIQPQLNPNHPPLPTDNNQQSSLITNPQQQSIHSFTQIQHPILSSSSSTTTTPSTTTPSTTTINHKFFNLPPPNYRMPCTITTDCKYITFGTHIGTLPTHDIRTGKQLTTFTHKHQSEILHAIWNPTRTQLITADCYELCFWVPSAR